MATPTLLPPPSESGLAGAPMMATPPAQPEPAAAPNVAGPAATGPATPPPTETISRHILDALGGANPADNMGWAKSIIAGGLAAAANVGKAPEGAGFLYGAGKGAQGVQELQRQKMLDTRAAEQQQFERGEQLKQDARAQQELEMHMQDANVQRAMWNAQTAASIQTRQQNAARFESLQKEDQLKVRQLEDQIQSSEQDSLAVLSAAGVDISKLEEITGYNQLSSSHAKQAGSGAIFAVPNGEEHKAGEDGAGVYLVPGDIWEKAITKPVTITTGYTLDRNGNATPQKMTAQAGTKVGTLLAIAKGAQVDLAKKEQILLDQAKLATLPYNVNEQLHREHPDWTPEQIQEASARATFPRIMPVNDAKGNTIGYNYFQGQPGGGVKTQFIPAGAGGAELPGGVIPPKPTATTLTMQQMASSVLPEAQRVTQEIGTLKQSLGPLAGRWNEVMVGKVGTNNPDVAKLQTDLTLLASAIVRTHFGARGGQEYLRHLENYFRLAQSPEDLQARIASADEWLTNYSKMAGGGMAQTPIFASAPGKPRLMSTDGGKTWQPAPQQ